VGGGPGKLYFDPQVVMAAVGDVIKFDFGGSDHTVTESSFEKPCTTIDGGIDALATALELPVKDATPRWFYCKAGNGLHCGAGMYIVPARLRLRLWSADVGWQDICVEPDGREEVRCFPHKRAGAERAGGALRWSRRSA
jgi:hypothetical protein